MATESSILLVNRHTSFLKRLLDTLPSAYEQLDTSRLTILFFALSGLDVLDSVDDIRDDLRERIIRWIYSLQIRTDQGAVPQYCGFRGGFSSAITSPCPQFHPFDSGHLAMTYTGLASLLILRDDFSNVDREGVLASVRACQCDDGSFYAHPGGSENDMRFVYCAVSICYMLQDFGPIDQERLMKFILQSWNYDGGFAQGPGLESHGGSTYCAVASLHMLGQLGKMCNGRRYERLLRWCVCKQNEGFHGRPSKPDDSCYTFWIGATLKLLNALQLVDATKAVQFTCSTQDEIIGGFAKYPDVAPDALHTYMSLSGLSLMEFPGLRPVNTALNVTERTHDYWRSSVQPTLLQYATRNAMRNS